MEIDTADSHIFPPPGDYDEDEYLFKPGKIEIRILRTRSFSCKLWDLGNFLNLSWFD
jgi:hypothetical protein